MKKKILVFCTTHDSFRSFLINHILRLRKNFEIVLVSNFDNKINIYKNLKINLIHINIKRKIHLIHDLSTFIKFFLILHSCKPSMILSLTPKAGLFGMLIGFLCGVKIRLHVFTGQVWANKSGFDRYFLKFFDNLISLFSTHLLSDSKGQEKFLITNKITSKNKIETVHYGSICGVYIKIFKPSIKQKYLIRKKLKINSKSLVIIYAGRINHEKGVPLLVDVFYKIKKNFNYNIFLLLIGTDEEGLGPLINKKLLQYKNCFSMLNYKSDIHKYFQASDIYCLPSEREGFGMSAIQASSCELPVICSDIYGLKNTVIHKQTGIKFRINNSNALYKSLVYLIRKKNLRDKYGKNGRKYIVNFFKDKIVLSKYNIFFRKVLNDHKKTF